MSQMTILHMQKSHLHCEWRSYESVRSSVTFSQLSYLWQSNLTTGNAFLRSNYQVIYQLSSTLLFVFYFVFKSSRYAARVCDDARFAASKKQVYHASCFTHVKFDSSFRFRWHNTDSISEIWVFFAPWQTRCNTSIKLLLWGNYRATTAAFKEKLNL